MEINEDVDRKEGEKKSLKEDKEFISRKKNV